MIFNKIPTFSLLVILAFASTAPAFGEDESIFDLSFEELTKRPITSVSKREEKMDQAPAAVFVLSQTDIMRSGANSIPEILRLVPGLSVARINSHTWAITSRGFNSNFANKLLVLIDGRSVYNPIFSGVNWDQIDLLLEDIERIEVIRGPGATVWGANAVNGVINIITKKVSDSQGGYFTAGGGSEENAAAGARYGGKINENSFAKVYAKGFLNDDSKVLHDSDNYDDWKAFQSGFRYDNQVNSDDFFTLHGDTQFGQEQDEHTIPLLSQEYSTEQKKDGRYNWSNILADWDHKISKDSSLEFQTFFDHHNRNNILADEESNTADLEIEYNVKANEDHLITAGLGYRHVDDSVDPTLSFAGLEFDPRSMQSDIFNTFIQDEITLIPEKLKFSLGTKLEHNDYSGLEVQPGVRISYTPTQISTFWASFSRAVRTPSRVEDGIIFTNQTFPAEDGTPTALNVTGHPNLESENLYAYELGYRVMPKKNLSFDVSTFINHYNDLFALSPGNPTFIMDSTFPHVEIPLDFANSQSGNTYGVEAVANWEPYYWWRLQAWYSYIDMNIEQFVDNETPENQAMLRSLITINEKFEIDPRLRFVDSVTALQNTDVIDAYAELDLRLGYRVRKGLVLSIVGQNLLDNRHQEYVSAESRTLPAEIERAVFAKIDWNF
jgi:iron complex outermembrane receptor protein